MEIALPLETQCQIAFLNDCNIFNTMSTLPVLDFIRIILFFIRIFIGEGE